MFFSGNFFGGVESVGLHTVTQAWAENTVMWDSLGGAYTGTAFSQNNGGLGGGSYTEWTIPQSVLQGWADNPATNFGIALIPSGGRDTYFAARETLTGNVPRIGCVSVAVVPEAGTLALLLPVFGVIGGVVIRRRTL